MTGVPHVSCGQPVVIGFATGCAPVMVDAEPVADGELVGRICEGDRLICYTNMEEQDYLFWDVPLDTPRYRRHVCPGKGSS